MSVYDKYFVELATLGSGGFGTVFLVKSKFSHSPADIFAVKKVAIKNFNENKVLKEVENLAKLDSIFVVKYYTHWIECNHLCIQMEFYSHNLRDFLKEKAIAFERQPESVRVFEYFISYEIFKEILESIQYLHELNPIIIHRDLKPENIMIDQRFTANGCVRVGDFGLATDHEVDGNSSSRYEHSACGTRRYIAPEVYSGRYNHKADIYSLAVIAGELFGIDLQSSQSFQPKITEFKAQMSVLYQTLRAMLTSGGGEKWRQRPECREVLAKQDEWSVSHKTLAFFKAKYLDKFLNPLDYESILYKIIVSKLHIYFPKYPNLTAYRYNYGRTNYFH